MNQQLYFNVYAFILKRINFSDFFYIILPVCYILKTSKDMLTLGFRHITPKKHWIVEISGQIILRTNLRTNNTFHSIIPLIYRGHTFLVCYWPLQIPSALLDLELQVYIQFFYNGTYFSTKHVQTLYHQKYFFLKNLKEF